LERSQPDKAAKVTINDSSPGAILIGKFMFTSDDNQDLMIA
jgi:hypothetical protein